MSTLSQLRVFVDTKRNEYPHLAEEFDDLYALCYAEIEDGGSMPHEIDLCVESINQLIEEE